MDPETEHELNDDYVRWAALIEWSAHAENEVEAEKPAVFAAELAKKWISTAPTEWNARRARYVP